jgi:hypothetical protein
MTEENSKKHDAEMKKIDKEIEEDIRHLKRSSNLLAALGLTIIVLFVILLAIKASQNFGPNTERTLPRFIESATITTDSAEVFEKPLPTSTSVTKLPEGTRILVMDDNPADWYKIHVIDPDQPLADLEGWVQKRHVRTRTEERQMRKALAESETQTIDITNVDWTIDEVGNYAISGKVVNLTNLPLSNVNIIITFYDQNNNVVEQRNTIMATGNPLEKSNPMPFVFIGKNEKSFNFVNCRADYRFATE